MQLIIGVCREFFKKQATKGAKQVKDETINTNKQIEDDAVEQNKTGNTKSGKET